MHTTRIAAAIAAAAALLVLAACSAEVPVEPAPTTEPHATEAPASEPYGPRQPTTGLASPWSVAFVGNSALVSGRDDGSITELGEDGSARSLAVLGDVVHGGEGGLLGIAVLLAHNEDDTTGAMAPGSHLYAYSTGPNGNRVQRFPLTGEPGALSLGDAETLLDGLPSGRTHNGGRIAFGPDGMLYVTVGDAGQAPLAQRPDSLAGKILRLTPDGGVPSDNPVAGSPVYSLGHRNPQGLAWADDGTMFAAEFGQNSWDELNVIVAGANYGWPNVEGAAGDERYTDPVQQWRTADASPSGIAIAGDTIYIANLRGQRIRAVPLSDLGAGTDHFVGEYGRIRHVAVAPDGTLWMLTNNTDGRGDPRDGDDRFIDTGLV